MNCQQNMCWQVRQTRKIEYDLRNVDDVFDPTNDALLAGGRMQGGRRFVVVDAEVLRHHEARIHAYFSAYRINAKVIGFSAGEAGKTVSHWLQLLRELDDFPIHRRDEPVIAIGGGVLTDVVGYAASSYRRGLPHIKVPTTLMGYVDAAVGIKTGINFNGHKNRLGSFEPPRRVLLDRSLLRTQDRRHLCNGLCEIIKLAIIKDAALFRLLEQAGADSLDCAFQDPAGGRILDLAISGMLEELAPDLFEDALARKVDFGHTFSYGLEIHHGDDLLHGEAVLLDMLVSTMIAHKRGLLQVVDVQRILGLVKRLGISPRIALLDADLMWQALRDRIEHRNGFQHVPLPAAIGSCAFVEDIHQNDIDHAINALHQWVQPTVTTRTHEGITEHLPGGNRPLQSDCPAVVGSAWQDGAAACNQ